jgi:predicted nucleic acid-binding protein
VPRVTITIRDDLHAAVTAEAARTGRTMSWITTGADAYFAALAIEHGCEWITADRGFARFPGLRWRHPLDG